jgi:hypothetical protein
MRQPPWAGGSGIVPVHVDGPARTPTTGLDAELASERILGSPHWQGGVSGADTDRSHPHALGMAKGGLLLRRVCRPTPAEQLIRPGLSSALSWLPRMAVRWGGPVDWRFSGGWMAGGWRMGVSPHPVLWKSCEADLSLAAPLSNAHRVARTSQAVCSHIRAHSCCCWAPPRWQGVNEKKLCVW